MAVTNQNYYGVASPTYQPAMRPILSITKAQQAVVTTTFDGTTAGDHDYSTGLIVRLVVPTGFGMVQADSLYGPITVLSDSTFSIDIDTSNFDTFSIPSPNPGHYFTPALVVPIGEVNSSLAQATRNVL